MSSVNRVEERQAIDPSSPWWAVHVARYISATEYVANRNVLDIACGTGYGLNILLEAGARQVLGVDIDLETAQEAQFRLKGNGGQVVVADGCRLPFMDACFDVITSFETLEHLTERSKFLAELRRTLKPGGLLILSTPNAYHTQPINGKPVNPFHVYEYTPEELRDELCNHFSNVKLLGQVLDSRFVIPPFWDEQEKLAKNSRMRWHVLLWRALNKLPFNGRDYVSRALWGQPLLPSESDYHFNEQSLENAPVLMALCK